MKCVRNITEVGRIKSKMIAALSFNNTTTSFLIKELIRLILSLMCWNRPEFFGFERGGDFGFGCDVLLIIAIPYFFFHLYTSIEIERTIKF